LNALHKKTKILVEGPHSQGRTKMRHHMLGAATLAAALLAFSAHSSAAPFSAIFSGFNELGALNAETGAIFSEGRGTLDLDLSKSAQTLTFKLTFSDLSTPITQSHIHFGKVHVAGGVIVFFCATPPTPAPAGTPNCGGGTSGTVTGTITAANIIGPTAQNITPGAFNALVEALESNTTYGNIHTTKFPAGEIRGEIRRGESED
jgi:CHRD domain